MMPLSVAEKLLLLAGGEQLPASTLKHSIVNELIEEHIVQERIAGRTKRTLFIPNPQYLHTWLGNHGINNLQEYIHALQDQATTRADLVRVSSNSKTQHRRTYQGFLVNSYLPIACTLLGAAFIVQPQQGTFTFVYDYEDFTPPPHVTIVGVENMENFRHIARQAHLFAHIQPLFVCRYPQEQSKDLIKWLLSIPNPYLHFGDYDFAGINIYLTEYHRHLGSRAAFYVPPHIDTLIATYGNTHLYNQQQLTHTNITDPALQELIALLHLHKKGLEQEVFLM